MRSWTVVAAFWPAVRPVWSRFSTRELTNSACVPAPLTCLLRSVRRVLTSFSMRVRRCLRSRSMRVRAVVPRRSKRLSSASRRRRRSCSSFSALSRELSDVRRPSTASTTASRATSEAPSWTATAFCAYSCTRSTGVLASSRRVSAAFLAAVVRLRASAAWLAERVCAAFLAAVERLVAFVLRWVVAVVAMWFGPLLGLRKLDLSRCSPSGYQRTHVCKPLRQEGYSTNVGSGAFRGRNEAREGRFGPSGRSGFGALQPAGRGGQLGRRRRQVGRRPGVAQPVLAAGPHDGVAELTPLGVLLELEVEAQEPVQDAQQRRTVLAPAVHRGAQPGDVVEHVGARAVHRPLRVALDQAHRPLHVVEQR